MTEPSRTDINFQREKEEKWKGKRKEGREKGNQGRERNYKWTRKGKELQVNKEGKGITSEQGRESEKSRNEQGIQGREWEK